LFPVSGRLFWASCAYKPTSLRCARCHRLRPGVSHLWHRARFCTPAVKVRVARTSLQACGAHDAQCRVVAASTRRAQRPSAETRCFSPVASCALLHAGRQSACSAPVAAGAGCDDEFPVCGIVRAKSSSARFCTPAVKVRVARRSQRPAAVTMCFSLYRVSGCPSRRLGNPICFDFRMHARCGGCFIYLLSQSKS